MNEKWEKVVKERQSDPNHWFYELRKHNSYSPTVIPSKKKRREKKRHTQGRLHPEFERHGKKAIVPRQGVLRRKEEKKRKEKKRKEEGGILGVDAKDILTRR
eukprot:TRINITY_DN594_c4_g1_i1.p1 TRINITY_DN594_c4_g1~~TRINITY_DN594_c4_g1_i1.p1  ORF type:complete len:102 (-),score=16.99 TRINITY_DN594_c4_g1_i1:88-393(-)